MRVSTAIVSTHLLYFIIYLWLTFHSGAVNQQICRKTPCSIFLAHEVKTWCTSMFFIARYMCYATVEEYTDPIKTMVYKNADQCGVNSCHKYLFPEYIKWFLIPVKVSIFHLKLCTLIRWLYVQMANCH